MIVDGGQWDIRWDLSTDERLVDDAVIPTPLAQGLTLFLRGLAEEFPDLLIVFAHG